MKKTEVLKKIKYLHPFNFSVNFHEPEPEPKFSRCRIQKFKKIVGSGNPAKNSQFLSFFKKEIVLGAFCHQATLNFLKFP